MARPRRPLTTQLPPPVLGRRRGLALRRQRYQSPGAAAASTPPREVEDPTASREAEQLRSRLVRLQADHENFRKRVQREREEHAKFALEGVMKELIVSLDNFSRAMAHRAHTPELDAFCKGLELTQQHLWDTLRRHGLERIDAQGRPFDPHRHEAMAAEEIAGVESGTVLDVFQEGYTLSGRVLRPALVKVAKAPPEGNASPDSAS